MGRQTYLAYATTGKEFDVEAALTERGFHVWCGKKVHFIRKGKKRRAEAETSPKLPNYIFLSLSADEWHDLHSKPVKHLASTMYVLRRDDEAQLDSFKTIVERDYAEGQRVAERNDKAEMVQFTRGQEMIDLRGRFGEQALRFRRIVERSQIPMIEAETDMMNRVVTVMLDPLDVRAYD